MSVPALSVPPDQYDPAYMSALLRVLTQYLNQQEGKNLQAANKADFYEVMAWLQ